ncbi:MAG: signal peptidase I [Kiritimatiellaeota bacterium]|nr:signal peptidase I [Kiritimatiellota bacterium]
MIFFERRKLRKQIKSVLNQAATWRAGHEDVMTTGQLAFLDEHISKASQARTGGDIDEMTAAGNALVACIERLDPPKPLAVCREWFDVFVVAFSVAMAFRAYFYQPFQIPTGSMQPTLYGIHAEPLDPAAMTAFDRQPLKLLKWFVTGKSFKVVRAKASGTVTFGDARLKPGYIPVIVNGVAHFVPSDVIDSSPTSYGLRGGVKLLQRVKAGDVLWSGIVTSGDFLFVNRWKWNFCHPKRGEVMVFSTSGMKDLNQPGTHYIKRMMGLPNETLQAKAPNLLVNGVAVTEPERVGQIARKERHADWVRERDTYKGFNPYDQNNVLGQRRIPGRTLITSADTVTLGPDEYYAMGDNSFNSFDSRAWGPVPERNLLGPASFVHWPFTSPRWGRIK